MTAATRTWNGSVSTAWSNAANWDEGVVPADGDDVVMTPSANGTSVNDLPAGLLLHSITINHNGVHVSGNAIRLGAGGLTSINRFFVSILSSFFNLETTLAAPQTWQGVDRPEPMQLVPVNLNGQTLRIISGAFRMYVVSGSGAIIQDGALANSGVFQSTWTGPLTVASGTFTVNGTAGAAVINGGTLSLYAGSPANVTLNSGTLDVENVSSTGPSHSGSINVVPSAGAGANIHIRMSVFNDTADFVTGTIALNNARLSLETSGPPPGGSVLVIFDNDGTDPVVGTFMGLAEGAIVIHAGKAHVLSYKGGDGNDVTLTTLFPAVTGTITTLESSANPSEPGATVTFTATVTGLSEGNVEFYDGNVLLATVPLDASGRAAIAVPLSAGTHSIVAAYTGTPGFATSQSAVVQQVIPPRRHATRR